MCRVSGSMRERPRLEQPHFHVCLLSSLLLLFPLCMIAWLSWSCSDLGAAFEILLLIASPCLLASSLLLLALTSPRWWRSSPIKVLSISSALCLAALLCVPSWLLLLLLLQPLYLHTAIKISFSSRIFRFDVKCLLFSRRPALVRRDSHAC